MRQPSSTYIPALDGLRAIAVLSVIIFHAHFLGMLPGGFTGVDIFFVISGYVISQSLSERSHLNFGDYLKDFYRRRFLRILPALLVMLSISFLVSAMFMPAIWLSDLLNNTGLAAFFGLSNFVLAWNTGTYFAPSAALERLRAPQMALLASLKQEHPDLTVWDPFPILCPSSICSVSDNSGKPLFFDTDHLSGHGNRVLTPSFTEVLLGIWRNTQLAPSTKID